ncbi:MAG: hypothetical protein KA771_00840 [Spirochaetales bacterium]|nr:hypothetical protein [Spirochaetales bacterium]
MESIAELLDKYRRLDGSERNKENALKQNGVSFHVGLGRSVWMKILGFDLGKYFEEPETMLQAQMSWRLFWHDRIPDDTVILPDIGIDFGVALEPSLFGMDSIFRSNADPWYGDPVINQPSDLSRLKIPDFYSSGLMPRVHHFYEKIRTLVGDDIPVRFTGWARGPWSVACMLRGFNALYLDLIDDPHFVEDLLDFIVHSRIEWEKQRCAFLGIAVDDPDYEWHYVVYRRVANSELFNDEVDGALFSFETYRDIIFPAEKALHDFYGSTRYYHSCGNMTPFLKKVKELDPELMHISSATDLSIAHAEFPWRTRFQCCMHPVDEILNADERKMADAISRRMNTAPGRRLELWADALYEGGIDTFHKVLKWLETGRNLVDGGC